MLRKISKLVETHPPFPFLGSWISVHSIQLAQLLVDCHNKTAPYTDFGIPIIRTSNTRNRKVVQTGPKFVSEESYQFWSRRCPPKSADIMFTKEVPMGESAIISAKAKYCLEQRTMLIRPMHEFVSNGCLLLVLAGPHLLERASEHAIGSTVKHLRVGDIENLLIPLPLLKKQNQIASKVTKLTTLCDQLKTKIQ